MDRLADPQEAISLWQEMSSQHLRTEPKEKLEQQLKLDEDTKKMLIGVKEMLEARQAVLDSGIDDVEETMRRLSLDKNYGTTMKQVLNALSEVEAHHREVLECWQPMESASKARILSKNPRVVLDPFVEDDPLVDFLVAKTLPYLKVSSKKAPAVLLKFYDRWAETDPESDIVNLFSSIWERSLKLHIMAVYRPDGRVDVLKSTGKHEPVHELDAKVIDRSWELEHALGKCRQARVRQDVDFLDENFQIYARYRP